MTLYAVILIRRKASAEQIIPTKRMKTDIMLRDIVAETYLNTSGV